MCALRDTYLRLLSFVSAAPLQGLFDCRLCALRHTFWLLGLAARGAASDVLSALLRVAKQCCSHAGIAAPDRTGGGKR